MKKLQKGIQSDDVSFILSDDFSNDSHIRMLDGNGSVLSSSKLPEGTVRAIEYDADNQLLLVVIHNDTALSTTENSTLLLVTYDVADGLLELIFIRGLRFYDRSEIISSTCCFAAGYIYIIYKDTDVDFYMLRTLNIMTNVTTTTLVCATNQFTKSEPSLSMLVADDKFVLSKVECLAIDVDKQTTQLIKVSSVQIYSFSDQVGLELESEIELPARYGDILDIVDFNPDRNEVTIFTEKVNTYSLAKLKLTSACLRITNTLILYELEAATDYDYTKFEIFGGWYARNNRANRLLISRLIDKAGILNKILTYFGSDKNER